jgi:hypothetical protein
MKGDALGNKAPDGCTRPETLADVIVPRRTRTHNPLIKSRADWSECLGSSRKNLIRSRFHRLLRAH